MTVYVCAEKDIECGDRSENWCLGCPKRGLLQVAVAPNAAAGPYPTAMRPATPEEHRWLMNAANRAARLVPHPDAQRLDWLEQHADEAIFDGPSEADPRFKVNTGQGTVCGATLREAIDFARGVTEVATRCGSYECRAAQQDGVLCADGECDRVNGARPAGVTVPASQTKAPSGTDGGPHG